MMTVFHRGAPIAAPTPRTADRSTPPPPAPAPCGGHRSAGSTSRRQHRHGPVRRAGRLPTSASRSSQRARTAGIGRRERPVVEQRLEVQHRAARQNRYRSPGRRSPRRRRRPPAGNGPPSRSWSRRAHPVGDAGCRDGRQAAVWRCRCPFPDRAAWHRHSRSPPPTRSATSRARADFPAPVGPTIAMGRTAAVTAARRRRSSPPRRVLRSVQLLGRSGAPGSASPAST